MKNIYLLILLMLGGYNLSAQVFFTESFEALVGTAGSGGDCACVSTPVDFLDGQNDHFARADPTAVFPNPLTFAHNGTDNYTGFDGSFIWVSEDNDDGQVGGSGNTQLCMTITTTIAGRTDLVLSGLFGANNSAFAYDPGDLMTISYNIDGAGFVEAMDFRDNAGSTTVSLDENGDDIGDDNVILTGMMQRVGVGIPTTGNNIVIQICTSTGASSEEFAFDRIQLAEAVLPVTLTKFDARAQDKSVILDWKTASETNNDYFSIERSTNGVDFDMIGRVAGYGTTTEDQEYLFVDNNPPAASIVYYRLAQYDFDGSMEFSGIRAVEFDKANGGGIQVYPNPMQEQAILDIGGAINEERQATIYSLTGQVVKQFQVPAGESYIPFDMSDMPQGSYLISVGSGNTTQNLRFLKMD